jgi:hypothetical protein
MPRLPSWGADANSVQVVRLEKQGYAERDDEAPLVRDSDTGEVVRCPYCGSGTGQSACSHCLALIDLNFHECRAGYSYKRFHEFSRAIEKYFLQQLRKSTRNISGRRDKLIGELWNHAVEAYSPGDEEISIEPYALTHLIIDLFEASDGMRFSFVDDPGVPGFASVMYDFYAKKPRTVFEAALAELRARLKKAKLPKGKARRAMHVGKQVTDKPQRRLSKKEYDSEMQAEVDKLKAEGKMPSLEEVLDIFHDVLKRHVRK